MFVCLTPYQSGQKVEIEPQKSESIRQCCCFLHPKEKTLRCTQMDTDSIGQPRVSQIICGDLRESADSNSRDAKPLQQVGVSR